VKVLKVKKNSGPTNWNVQAVTITKT